ncbi:MAG TPA: sulfotransferase [Stellaceae bacterium]|jgi:hypothetical protein|nr:sulfotransferase [Stellaceae bacterium]
MSKKYLFVCGCPRSGTTALWRLIAEHPQIVLGVERYAHLAFKKGGINPDLFEKKRFFDLRPGDTFYQTFDFNSYYDVVARRRFDDAIWVGDKLPLLDLDYKGVEENFERAHLLYIVRNIIDVAGSYQKRAEDPTDDTWNATLDYRRAVHDWYKSIKATLEFLALKNRRTQVSVILYDDLFLQRADLGCIFDWLNLSVDKSLNDQYDRLLARSNELDARRGDCLNSAQRQYISMHAPFGLYRQLLEKRLIVPPESAASQVE